MSPKNNMMLGAPALNENQKSTAGESNDSKRGQNLNEDINEVHSNKEVDSPTMILRDISILTSPS